MTKRIISGLLVLVLLFAAVPVSALAAQLEEAAAVDTGEVSIEGTNGFGTLLSQEITESQTEAEEESAEYEAGYTVTDLTIEGTTATVTYDSMEEALLVVALYTEDGMRMVTSATATVTADATEATVEFTGDMPEYFLASAYLVDTYDLSPLCAAYDTPMYTQEMQELLASTVEDYDADRVLNLDDDNTTNFAVYADTTKVIEAVEGTNTVASIDDENATYVIENADEQITSLAVGDVFVYPYAENEYLIVKVGAITINGATVTIIGADVAIEDVFATVKVELNEADLENGEMAQSCEAGKKNGIYQPQGASALDSSSASDLDDSSASESQDLMLKFEFGKDEESSDETLAAGINGSATFGIRVGFAYYATEQRRFAQLTLDYVATIDVHLEFKVEGHCIRFPETTLKLLRGAVKIKFKPVIELSVSGQFGAVIEFTAGIGCSFDSETGFRNLCTNPYTEVTTKSEITFFVGVDLNPSVSIIKSLFGLGMSAEVGLQLKSEMSGLLYDLVDTTNAPETKHSCNECVDGEISFVVESKAWASVFENLEWFKWEFTFPKFRIKFADFYVSTDFDTSGFTECPHLLYRVNAKTVNEDGETLHSSTVMVNGNSATTNAYGVAVFYLNEGLQTFTASNLNMTGTSKVYIDQARKVTILLKEPEEDAVTWRFNENTGVLIISGNGAFSTAMIPDFEGIRPHIKQIIFKEGITGVGQQMFRYCENLVTVDIPGTFERVSQQLFAGCPKLEYVKLGEGVTEIVGGAFAGCTSLKSITIPNTVTAIGNGAFEECSSLVKASIGSGVQSFGQDVFKGCTSLTSIVLPDSVTALGQGVFANCTNLKNVTLSSNLACISIDAFAGCTSLKSVEVPASVTMIEIGAFCWCTNLTSITLQEGLSAICLNAIKECPSLSSITIPSTVTVIGKWAFCNNTAMNSVYFKGPAPSMGSFCFQGVTANVYYPANDETWTDEVRQQYSGNLTWIPYTPDSGENTVETANTLNSAYSGETDSEVTETYTQKTAYFENLVPGERYVMLDLVNIDADDLLDADNLLFIDQGVALEDGTLSFQYVQRETADISYVVACGASNKDLNDAEITFPEMTADGELQVVDPTVVYDGVTLTEGRDYTIVGTVDFTKGGTYTCYIRGIHNYTGLVACEYTVIGAEVANGWSGACQWTLTDDGVLTVYGSGNMKNYGYGGGQPWAAYADQITAVIIEEGVTAVGSGAFRNMTALESVTLPASGLSKIGEAAFYGCTSLKEIYIPDGVYTIWAYTFKNCTALTDLRLPGTLIKVDQGAFEACTGLTELFIPGETEIIGAWSFKGCTGLVEADMQWADATEIREGAFKNCTALTDVLLPADIQILGDSAFYGIGAATFTVPATVTTVGPWCFARAALTEVTFEGNAPAIGEGAFNKITLTAYYPGDNATWTSDIMQNYGGTITWKAN